MVQVSPRIALRRARIEAGLSQGQLGKMIGCHWVTVSRWEMGHRIIPAEYAIRIVDVLGLQPQQLRPDIFR